MGVKSLWQLINGANLIQQWSGQNPTDVPAIAAEMEGKVLAIDLSMWIMQAGEQLALIPHCNQVEAAAKVAFERAIHWLRFGITPVFVIEGLAPAEKKAAQHRRLYDSIGGEGRGGTTNNGRINSYNNVAAAAMGPTQFIRSSQQVAAVLEALGLPVMQAPGEAEATCAALCTAGLVDGVASFDGDTLLFGAEVVYPVVKLSGTQEKNCQVTKCTLEAVRNHLGLTAPGSGRHALGLFAVLCGCDYDESGAQGIGGVGAMALVKKLLTGCTDDKTILDRFEVLLNSEPDLSLTSLVKCTGCLQCKHEGGNVNRIKAHSARNPCPCCPPAVPSTCRTHSSQQNQGCIPQLGECQCAFHLKANDRLAERVATKARAEPDVAQRARDAVAVYLLEAEAAGHAVEHEMILRNILPGEKLTWLHRPNVKGVHQAITSLQKKSGSTLGGALDWDQSTLRSKMIPALMEWDLRHPPSHTTNLNITSTAYSFGPNGVDTSRRQRNGTQVEFIPKIIKKIQGSGVPGTQWRYLVEFERVAGVDIENFGTRLKPLRSNSGSGVARAADILLSSPNGDESLYTNDDFATQRPIDNAEGIDVGVFDGQWLASDLGKNHRGVRMSLIREKWPELEAAFLEKGSRATPATARRRAAGGSDGVRNKKQQQVASTPSRPRNLAKSLLNTPTGHPRHRHHQDQWNMPPAPGSIDRYLVQQRRDTTVKGRIEEEAVRLVSPGVTKKGTTKADGASGSGRGVLSHEDPSRTMRSTPQVKQKQLEEPELQLDEGVSLSPSKKHRSSTPADTNHLLGSGRVVPESENLKTLKSLIEKRKARLLAEAERLGAMTEEERAARLERTRQRGAELGRLFAAGGGGGGRDATTAAATTEEEEKAEVINLVTPVSSSASEEQHDEEEEDHRPSPPPAVSSRRNRRQRPQQDHQEEIVIDLTGDLSE